MPLLFAYGTLKRGCKNHAHLPARRYLGEAQTGPGWALYDLGDYPGMVADAAGTEPVRGELWEVDETAWSQLDRFEGVDEGLYVREEIVLAGPAGTAAYTYRYLLPHEGRPRLPGVWSETLS